MMTWKPSINTSPKRFLLPITAAKQYDRIAEAILTLEKMPERRRLMFSVEYLEKNGSEVRNMIFAEFNLEEAKEVWFEEGMEKGKEEIARNLLERGCYSVEEVSDIARLPVERVRTLVN